MRKLIIIGLMIVMQSNTVIAKQKPELIGFECRKEFNVGVPSFDGTQTTSGSKDNGIIRNFVLKTGSTKDGYPTSNFTDYHTSVDENMGFALIYFKSSAGNYGAYRYFKINISIAKPVPKPGEWSEYNNNGILSEAVIGDILISADEYKDFPEKCRIKLSY